MDPRRISPTTASALGCILIHLAVTGRSPCAPPKWRRSLRGVGDLERRAHNPSGSLERSSFESIAASQNSGGSGEDLVES